MSIKVLIADDSMFMRKTINNILSTDPEIEIVGLAKDGQEAVEMVRNLKPDVVTMDIEMPRMTGIEALKIIMAEMPVPVLMISSLTKEGAQETLTALELGAVDYIAKNLGDPNRNLFVIKNELIVKIKAIAHQKKTIGKVPLPKYTTETIRKPEISSPSALVKYQKKYDVQVVAIGASTGGPKAVQEIVPLFPRDFSAGILIIQHMPALFTQLFAERLAQISKVKVRLAKGGEIIEPGMAYVAPGGQHLLVKKNGSTATIFITKDPPMLYTPSIDLTFNSVAEIYPGRAIGVLLTGMGADGAKGLKAIKESEGKTIAQDQSTCVIFGMPKAAIDLGIVDKIVPLPQITSEVMNMV